MARPGISQGNQTAVFVHEGHGQLLYRIRITSSEDPPKIEVIPFGVAVLSVVTCAPMCKHPRGPPTPISCNQLCPDDFHPVCAVDAQGLPRTFPNRCLVDFAYCREGKYYAIMKDGEC